LALFWIVQAASGIVLVFRWEIEDATVPGARVPVDLIALGKRIEATTRERGVVSSLWATSAAADRFDIYYTDSAAAERILRVDGAGRVLRDRASDLKVAEGAIFDSLTAFHRSLFAGTTGKWLVGISGVLLLTNLALGLRGWAGRIFVLLVGTWLITLIVMGVRTFLSARSSARSPGRVQA
jgi:uncharacterized iron-regulated membrane protein